MEARIALKSKNMQLNIAIISHIYQNKFVSMGKIYR